MLWFSRAKPVPQVRVPAVMVVDMQTMFLNQLATHVREKLVTAHERLLRVCAEKDIPVIVAELERYGETAPDVRQLLKSVPRVDRVTKPGNSVFSANETLTLLSGYGANTIILCGVNASFCVWETAKDARTGGYYVAVDADCMLDTQENRLPEKVRRKYSREGMLVPDVVGLL